ncbi:hypothetical protein T4D_9677 [Trichinella pseudospiralis]|uniref:E3 ubiquitin-protein ligase RNF220 middle domain-containing protein n=1 Tax=Trichinella pseudospiralis TaxID=6337 RepID=A0A0V1FMR8_TRIPS|nr:hypothetical protein T4D_9677 [Trichinella pseudospiralis]
MFTNCGSMFGLNLDNGQLPSPPPPTQQAPQPPLTNSLVSCPSTTTLLPVATAPPPTLLASALFPQSVNAAGQLPLFPFLARPNLHILANHSGGSGGSSSSGGGGGGGGAGAGGGGSGSGSSAFGYSGGTLWTSGDERRGSQVDRPVTLADVIAQLQKVSNTPLSVKESQPIRKKHRPSENFTCPICGEEVAEKLIEQHFEKESQNLEKRFIKLNATIKFESNFNTTTESNLEVGCSSTEAERNSTGRYEMFCRIRINRESRLRGKLTGFRYYTSTHMPIDIQKEEDIEGFAVDSSKWTRSPNQITVEPEVTEEKANSNSPFSCDSTELSSNEQQLNPQLINEPDIDVESMQGTEQIDASESPHSVESSDSETVHSPYQILTLVSTTAEATTTTTTTTTTSTT